ncbi:hypothetical protein ACWJKU_01420 [Methylocaldum sp. MU1018]
MTYPEVISQDPDLVNVFVHTVEVRTYAGMKTMPRREYERLNQALLDDPKPNSEAVTELDAMMDRKRDQIGEPRVRVVHFLLQPRG